MYSARYRSNLPTDGEVARVNVDGMASGTSGLFIPRSMKTNAHEDLSTWFKADPKIKFWIKFFARDRVLENVFSSLDLMVTLFVDKVTFQNQVKNLTNN